MNAVRPLIHAWLVLDFFGDARRRGGSGSTLTTTIFAQSFLALVFAALLFPETPPIPFAAANLCLSTLLVAVSLLGDEDRVGRRRADRALIGTSPVAAVVVVLARAGHAAFYLCLITIGMALPPAILLGFLRGSPATGAGYVALACASSGLAAGGLAVAMRLAARLLGHARAALLSGSVKAMLLGGGLAMFALGLQRLRGTVDDLPIGRLGAELLPPYQAARLLDSPVAEAWRLGALLITGALLLVLAVLLGEAEAQRGEARRRVGPLRHLLRGVAGDGPRLGLAEFVATSMWRSPGFRARVLPLLGLPAGMIYLSLQGGDGDHAFVFLCVLLQLPAIYLPFLIAFLPRADQENSRWVFDQAPPFGIELARDATWRALVTHVLVPVHLLGAAILVPIGGAPVDTLAATAFSLAIAAAVARPMCSALTAVPFTDDSGGEPATDLGGLFPFALLLLGLAIVYGAALGRWGRLGATAAAVVLAVMLLRRRPPDVADRAAPDTGRAEHGEPQHASEQPVPTVQPDPDASLRRELRAIVLLYGAVSVVPFLIGLALTDGR